MTESASDGVLHLDDMSPDTNSLGGVTALYYVNYDWDINYAGETVFLDSYDGVGIAVTPKPGRLVLFDGRIQHVARPPARWCPYPRITLTMKFLLPKAS